MPSVAMVTTSLCEGNSMKLWRLARVILWWVSECSEGLPHILDNTDSVTKDFVMHELVNSMLYT